MLNRDGPKFSSFFFWGTWITAVQTYYIIKILERVTLASEITTLKNKYEVISINKPKLCPPSCTGSMSIRPLKCLAGNLSADDDWLRFFCNQRICLNFCDSFPHHTPSNGLWSEPHFCVVVENVGTNHQPMTRNMAKDYIYAPFQLLQAVFNYTHRQHG